MKLKFIEKFLLLLNVLMLFIQLKTFHFIPSFHKIVFIDLILPYIIIINLFFFFFWILKSKWPFTLFIPFFIFYNQWGMIYQFPRASIRNDNNIFNVMSYNVRLFNKYDWIKEENVPKKIANFIKINDPDIISFQEYSIPDSPRLTKYPYKYIQNTKSNGSVGLAIFSKFPIINKGFIKFDNSNNSGMFTDIIYNYDTLRVYNLHLESLRIDFNDSLIKNSSSNKVKLKLDDVFEKQINQAKIFHKIDRDNNYASIVCADLNNSSFSSVYRKIKGDRIDAFTKAGKGLGTTFNIFLFPFRIDFIFSDKKLKVYDFKTHKNQYLSDHKAISVKLGFKKN